MLLDPGVLSDGELELVLTAKALGDPPTLPLRSAGGG